MTINADEELVHGDWGYGAGSWEVTATMNATGVPFNLNGKFLHVAKRQADGAWKLYRHAWNAPTQYAALAATQG